MSTLNGRVLISTKLKIYLLIIKINKNQKLIRILSRKYSKIKKIFEKFSKNLKIIKIFHAQLVKKFLKFKK